MNVARIKKKSIKSNRLLREFMMRMVHFRRYGCSTPRTCQDPPWQQVYREGVKQLAIPDEIIVGVFLIVTRYFFPKKIK